MFYQLMTISPTWTKCCSKTTNLLTELLDRPPPLDEMLKEAMLPLQVPWGEESQVNHHVVGHILVVERAQQLLQARLFLAQFDQVHKLQDGKNSVLIPVKTISVKNNWLHETHSVMEVLNSKLSEAFINQVKFTFRRNCFEPENRNHMFNNPPE